jgi:hypothetical protein
MVEEETSVISRSCITKQRRLQSRLSILAGRESFVVSDHYLAPLIHFQTCGDKLHIVSEYFQTSKMVKIAKKKK